MRAIWGLVLVLATGCGTRYQAQTVPVESTESAFKAGIRAIVATGHEIDVADSTIGLIATAWRPYPELGADFRLRITIDTLAKVRIDCRNRITLELCDSSRVPDALAGAANSIAREMAE